jgi:beta-N-acetylhexosaminidase
VPRERLESLELPPFRAAIAEGVGAVMSAHIWLPKVEPEKGVPSTLSKNVLGGILRDELGFKGIVFTDAMTMRGVSAHFANADATIRAVEAGVDMLVHPPSVEDSFNALKSAVASGRIPQSRIDQSVRRILAAKAQLDLEHHRFTDVNKLPSLVGTREHKDLGQRIADHAITLVRDDRHVLPLKPSPELRVVQINLLDTRNGWREGPVGQVMAAEMLKRFPRAVTVQVDDQSTVPELDLVRKLVQLADAIVINGFIRVAAYKGSIDLTAAQTSLLHDLVATKKPLVYTAFGSPYVLTHVTELPSYIVAYDITPSAELAAVRAITGEIEFRGKLPISLPGLYPIGHGLAPPR